MWLGFFPSVLLSLRIAQIFYLSTFFVDKTHRVLRHLTMGESSQIDFRTDTLLRTITKVFLLLFRVVLASLALASTASAQSRIITNPSFEDGPTPNNFSIHSADLQPGWQSTNDEMETWADGFQSRDAQDGNFFIELNPRAPVGLFQNICIRSNEALSWDVQHAARGETGGADQTIVYEIMSLDGTTTHQTLFSNTLSPMGSAGNNNTNNLWDNVTGSTVYTGPTGVQRLQFRSTNPGSVGNFLDNVNIALVPIVSFENLTSSVSESSTDGLPQFVINGAVPTAFTINFSITGGTATDGLDYTVSSNSISIPVGVYDGVSASSMFPLPINIINDFLVEGDETIEITYQNVSPASAAVLTGPGCTAAATVATHTIEDPPSLPELTLTKTADDDTLRILGDTIIYTYSAENTGNVFITDVSLSDVHSGSGTLSPISIQTFNNTSGNSADDGADNDIDLLAPGDSATFTASYIVTAADISAGTDITNTATATGSPADGTLVDPSANEIVTLSAPGSVPPLPPLVPGTCGDLLAEAYLLDGMGIGNGSNHFLNSGSPTHDPDVFFGSSGVEHGYTKNADGTITYFFDNEPLVSTASGQINVTIGNVSSVGGNNNNQTNAAEFWRVTARLYGEPGQPQTFTLSNGNPHELYHYWIEDSAGTVIETSLGATNTANGWVYGRNNGSTDSGNATFPATSITGDRMRDISYTLPATNTDGIAYFNAMIYDPSSGWGPLTFSGQPACPLDASLEANKTVAMFGTEGNAAYALPGNDVIYSIAITNTGEGPTDIDSIELIDIMPPEVSFWNGDIDFDGPDNFSDTTPVALVQSAGAGLTFNYNTDVRFGFGATPPADFDACTFVAPDNTYRADVTYICLNPKGALNAGSPDPTLSLNFRARIE